MDDFDIEMGDAGDVMMDEPAPPANEDILQVDDPQEDGEIDDTDSSNNPVLTKVHISGLSTIDADQLKTYLATYLSEEQRSKQRGRIEWIDDDSANIVFSSDDAAADALAALAEGEYASVPSTSQPRASFPAKAFISSGSGDTANGETATTRLRIRIAVEGDKKIAGAAGRSRFYLLNPEWDPEERKRKNYRERDNRGGRYGRRRREDDRDDEVEKFDESLYDDAQMPEDSLAKRVTGRQPRNGDSGRGSRRYSRSPSESDRDDRDRRRRRRSSPRGDARVNGGKELFPDRESDTRELFPGRKPSEMDQKAGRSRRNRSASPPSLRKTQANDDGAGDSVQADLEKDREAVRNRERAKSIREKLAKNRTVNKANGDLFPDKTASTDRDATWLANGSNTAKDSNGINIRGTAGQTSSNMGFSIKGAARSARELFPNRFSNASTADAGVNAGKELFSDRLEGKGRRRQKAEDLFL